MGDVTGPISTLPGSSHDLPKDATCDEHPNRPAVVRIQGETDSFGSEMNDMCQECADEYRAWLKSPEATTGRCDWCKKEAPDLRDTRDHEEGMAGPVYSVCGSCRKRRDDELKAEAAAYDDYSYDDDNEYDADDDDWLDMECGLASDGQCSQAGTEHCDFVCPRRNSENFAGSKAWRVKHGEDDTAP